MLRSDSLNIFEDLAENEKKIGMLLDIISGCDNQGKPIEMDIKERKYSNSSSDSPLSSIISRLKYGLSNLYVSHLFSSK